jgi:ABC-type glycerol-3-phosphate transport system substrate-binding protein
MKTILAALLAAAALAGCGSEYILSTSTGAMLESSSKPYLNERTGMYEYRTKDGKDAWIRKEQVVEILER